MMKNKTPSMMKVTKKVTNPVKVTKVAIKKGAKLPAGKGMVVAKTIRTLGKRHGK